MIEYKRFNSHFYFGKDVLMRKINKWISFLVVSLVVVSSSACEKKAIEPEYFQSIVESMEYYNFLEVDAGEYAEKRIIAQKRLSETAIFAVILDYYKDKNAAKESFDTIEEVVRNAETEGIFEGSIEASRDGSKKRITVNGTLSQPLLDPVSIPASFNVYVVFVLKDDVILKVISYENGTDKIEEAERVVAELGF
jgi:hypothetical protein